jgi:CDP-diacylglycerol--glycerol-3-phosphate 3-phosphatidyltransferase
MNVANLITILRFPMLVVVVVVLYLGGTVGQLIDVLLILILILMDTLDGVVARRRGEQTLIGSALDIAADRTVEIVLWVAYAHQGLISVAIPLTVIIRGALTDAARAVALQRGQSAHTMMRTTLGRWLVASAWMRTSYSVSKVSAFLLLALTVGLRSGGYAVWRTIWTAGVTISWLALALCILRGLPVLVESADFLRSPDSGRPTPSSSQ